MEILKKKSLITTKSKQEFDSRIQVKISLAYIHVRRPLFPLNIFRKESLFSFAFAFGKISHASFDHTFFNHFLHKNGTTFDVSLRSQFVQNLLGLLYAQSNVATEHET